MPHAPPHLCPRCRIPVLGRCSTCQKQRYKRVDATRGTSTERGYTADWRVLRIAAFVRDGWTCVDCGWAPDIISLYRRLSIPELPPANAVLDELRRRKNAGLTHLHGDHIETIASAPSLRLDIANVQTLCRECHARKTARESGSFSTST